MPRVGMFAADIAPAASATITPPRRAYSPEPECRMALTALEAALRFRVPACRKEEELLARVRRVQATVRRGRMADEYACFHALAALTRFYSCGSCRESIYHPGCPSAHLRESTCGAFPFTDAEAAAVWDTVAFIDTMGERAVHPAVVPGGGAAAFLPANRKEGFSHA